MPRIRFLFVLSLLVPGWVAGAGPTAKATNADPIGTLAPIDPTTSPAWRDFLDQLSTPTTRYSTFSEFRYFPFRRTPVELSGEIRIDPDHGFSLNYLKPKEQLLIVDAAGVLMRDAKGRQRAAPANSRATRVADTLTHVLNFDLTALATDFDLRGTRAGESWRLELIPRNPEESGAADVILLEGTADTLTGIEMRTSARQRVVIRITDTREGVTFTDDAISRFFR